MTDKTNAQWAAENAQLQLENDQLKNDLREFMAIANTEANYANECKAKAERIRQETIEECAEACEKLAHRKPFRSDYLEGKNEALKQAAEAIRLQGAGQPQHLPASVAHGADIRAQAAKMCSSLWAIAKTLDDNELRDYALQAYESAALPSVAPILEREAFEGEMKILWDLDPEDFKLAFRRNKHEPEKYRDYEMQKAWTIWKAARAALSAPAIPEGHAIVPIEPTHDMKFAGMRHFLCRAIETWPPSYSDVSEIYTAMLAAAPIPASPKTENHLGHECKPLAGDAGAHSVALGREEQ